MAKLREVNRKFWMVWSPFSTRGPFPLTHSISDNRKEAIEKVARDEWWKTNGPGSNIERRDFLWKHLYRRGFRVYSFDESWFITANKAAERKAKEEK